jgi:tRNA threonylcarbamoyladenosine biosynthesis protein TsaB
MPAKLSDDPAPAYLLACDTTQGACSVAVMRDDALLAERVEPMQRGHAEALMPMIAAVLEQAGVLPSALTRLGVTTGPGGFTGVRLGLAAMRAYAVALEIPLLGVGSFEAMAMAEPAPEPVLVAVDVRRGQFYAQLFDASRTAITAPQLYDLAALQHLLPQVPFRGIGVGVETLNAAGLMTVSDAPPYPQARYVGQIAQAAPATASLPLPLYLRPADASLPDPSKRPAHAPAPHA